MATDVIPADMYKGRCTDLPLNVASEEKRRDTKIEGLSP